MASANDYKILSYSHFSIRPWAHRLKGFSAESTTSFALKKEKGVICSKGDDIIISVIRLRTSRQGALTQRSPLLFFENTPAREPPGAWNKAVRSLERGISWCTCETWRRKEDILR